MTYSDNVAAAANIAFQQDLGAAMLAYVDTVMNEGTNVTYHVQRVRLAEQVAANPAQWGINAALAVAENLGLTAATVGSVTDAELNTAVAAIWDDFAGTD